MLEDPSGIHHQTAKPLGLRMQRGVRRVLESIGVIDVQWDPDAMDRYNMAKMAGIEPNPEDYPPGTTASFVEYVTKEAQRVRRRMQYEQVFGEHS